MSDAQALVALQQQFDAFRQQAGNVIGAMGAHLEKIYEAARTAPQDHKTHVPITTTPFNAAQSAIRAIAFYLPQFHAIPENDAWWGKGFTEWTNVTRAVPQFPGHEQPILPGELGFYDLRLPSVMQRQVELAKMYGIGGFCFHHYWFNGRKLIEHPIEHYLKTPELDLPFCINWANETWSRTWLGEEKEILIQQNHNADDDIAFINDISRFLRDPRYIRIDGKPLVMLYRHGLLPDPRATVERWRKECRKNGVGEIFVAFCETFTKIKPQDYDVDAMVEFPPHFVGVSILDKSKFVLNQKFTGRVLDYGHTMAHVCLREVPDFPLFRTVMPAWDNTARRPDTSDIFYGNTPQLYHDWLAHMCNYTVQNHKKPGHDLVFINAWNEWAEGAILEPSRRHGYAYLQATAEALSRFPSALEA